MSCPYCDPDEEARIFAESIAALPKKEQDAVLADLLNDMEHRSKMWKALFEDKRPISGGSFTIPLHYS